MRKVLFLIVAVLLVWSCSSSPEQRARDIAEAYIKTGADDPSSVQDVEVTFLEVKKEMDAEANRVRRQRVMVRWREKNAYGALVKRDAVVKFDEDVRQMVCFGCY